MRLVYGTYATPVPPMGEALSAMAETGYEGVGPCAGPEHVMPEDMNRLSGRD